MRMLLPFVIALVLTATRPVHAQPAADNGRKQARAVPVTAGAIRVDGRLDEDIWRSAPPVTDFLQREPTEGAPPTDDIEVRFAYDEAALYVGARMSSATAIQAPMGRRDEVEQAEQLLVSLDTYLDRRTASTFGVTASGVRLDHYYASDNDWDSDSGFDPVWEARTAMIERGWVAELRIPFSQLRFNDRSPQVWGLNLQRLVPARNEEIYWALVRRTEEGWASRFGELHGIDGITPPRRLELLPYVGGSSQLMGNRDRSNPFDSAANLESRVGVDAKMGLGPNLTLEATVNPDFGQVEADPAEVNLSAFETFFDERRPFFLEGMPLLAGGVEDYFYSRRIGAPPSGPATGDFVDYPSTTTILGAAKLTGRLSSGTSIGMLGAATAEETARTFRSLQLFDRTRVAPQTGYGVARLQQEFGSEGSTVGLLTTAVHRQLAQGDLLAALLARNAFTLSGDSVLRFLDGDYELGLNLGLSYVDGDARAIDRIQRSSARYFQRPDASYIRYNPARTSLAGVRGGLEFERRNARHWLWEAGADFGSPEFETNDVGRLGSTDYVRGSADIGYRETTPGPRLRAYEIGISADNQWNYNGDRQAGSLESNLELTWPNFWQTQFSGSIDFRSQDWRLTRGGPSMGRPRSWMTNADIESNDQAQTRGNIEMEYGRNEDGGLTFNIEGGISLQPDPRWQLAIQPRYERLLETQQYVTTLDGGRPETYGRRYIFGHVDRSTYSTEVRLNYTFRPDLNVDFYAEPFASSGRYDHLGELKVARSRHLRRYGTDDTTMTTLPDGSRQVVDGGTSFTLRNRDFRVQSLRSNLVLRWEWRPGSTLYVVWQQNRAGREESGTRVTIGDMFDSFGARGDNLFAVKTSFWFSLN